MTRREPARVRFVRAVRSGAAVHDCDGDVEAAGVRLGRDQLASLVSDGVLQADGSARAETRYWLKRQLLDEAAFAAQHRIEAVTAEGLRVNLAESPLARLASGAEPFLARHQLDAGEKIRRLYERAQLQPRLTMSYSATHTAGKGVSRAHDLGDMAIQSRKQLASLHRSLPSDCAGVVLDVCGLLKGLQQVESERGWPRRSAKLVLRIGLEQAARHFGLTEVAEGPENRRARVWGERPGVVG